MPAFLLNQIVRPKLRYLSNDKSGGAVDWQGRYSAQGWIYDVGGGADAFGAGATIWDPQTSTTIANTTGAAQRYGVRVWDYAGQLFRDLNYPEGELDAGTVGGQPITSLFPDPLLSDPSSVLCSVRE
jgi:hypothetical protein